MRSLCAKQLLARAEDARAGAKLMYHNDRVLRVMLVTDSAGAFVEWVER